MHGIGYKSCAFLRALVLYLSMCAALFGAGGYAYSDDTPGQAGFPAWDVNQDGQVDYSDVLIVAQHFGQKAAITSESNPDVNDDGEVNILDLILVGRHFGEIYPQCYESRQWQITELDFTSARANNNPWTVRFSAVFTGPDSFEVPGFWDGGQSWKIRFMPTLPGSWTYTTKCEDDETLSGQTGCLTVAEAALRDENPIYAHGGILKVSQDKRYLTYTDGTPFFWLGDTWWFCPSDLVPFEGSSNPEIESAYRTLIDTRRTQGYTVAQMTFGERIQGVGIHDFHQDFLQKRPNDAIIYWQEVDKYMDYANDSGIIPVIGLAFHEGMDLLSLEEWKVIWRYFVARYGAHAITWLICGEYNVPLGNVEGRVRKVLDLGQFIKDTDPYKRAMTIHPWWHGGDDRQAWSASWYDFIMLQGGHSVVVPPTISFYLDIYQNQMYLPMLESEVRYEGICGFVEDDERRYEGICAYTDNDVRCAAYRAIQAGSFGFTYGAQGLWYPTQNENDYEFKEYGEPLEWWKSLKRPGGAQMRYLKQCYESVEWWKLSPRPDVIRTAQTLDEHQKILVKSDTGKTFLIYFPEDTQNVKTRLVGFQKGTEQLRYSIEIFDPRTGFTQTNDDIAVAGGELNLPSRPSHEDWVMILRSREDAIHEIIPPFGTEIYVKLDDFDMTKLSGMWLLDEGQGKIAGDLSENGNDGEIFGAKWVDGRFGKALDFDGKDDYVEVPDAEGLDAISQITVVTWVKYDQSPPQNYSPVGKESDYRFIIAPGGEEGHFVIATDNNNWYSDGTVAHGGSITTGEWHHLAGTYDGKLVRFFVDGWLVGKGSQEVSGNVHSSTNPFHIAKNIAHNIDSFAGIIDEVAVFNVALSEDDIRSIMTHGLEKAIGDEIAVSPAGKKTTTWANANSQY